jgi:hypothetical protein
MGSVLNPPRPPAVRRHRPALLTAAGLAAAVAALLLATRWLTPTVSFVDRVTIDNPTPYHLEVDVIGAGRSVAVAVGALGPEQTKDFRGVIDQGREWTFRFSSGPTDGGEVRIARARLVGDRWRVTVPPDVADRLRAGGVPPSPRE